MGSLPEGLDSAAIRRVYPVMWFQFFRMVPVVSAGVGWGSHPAHIILLFTAFAAPSTSLSGLCSYRTGRLGCHLTSVSDS